MNGGAGSDRAFIDRSLRIAIVVFVVVAILLGLLWLLKAALTPLATALVIAYLFDPLIDRFEERGVSRTLAIGFLLVVIGAVLFAVAFFLIPAMQREVAVLAESLPDALSRGLGEIAPRLEQQFGVTLPTSLQEFIASIRTGELKIPIEALRGLLERLVVGVTGTVGALVALLLIPVLAYYLLVEFDRLRFAALDLVPQDYQGVVSRQAARVDSLVAGFIRGQLTVCLLLGVLYAAGFAVIGVDLAVLIGVISGLLAIIPYIGGIAAIAMASTMTLIEFGFDIHLVLVIGWYSLVQGLEGFVLTPKIVGGSLGMHPVTVIVALLIGGDLLGFLGLLIAVPLAAVVQVFLQDLVVLYRRSPVYRGHDAGASTADDGLG